MRTRIPVDESERKARGLLLLLSVVVAGFSWQIASRTGLAEPAGTWRDRPVPVGNRTAAVNPPSAQVDFASRLGLAKPGTQRLPPANAWMQKPGRTAPRAAIATASFSAPGFIRAAGSSRVAESEAPSGHENEPRGLVVRHQPRVGGNPSMGGAGYTSETASRAGWTILEPDDDRTADTSDEDATDSEVEDSDTVEPVPESDDAVSGKLDLSPNQGAQMLVLGPAVTSRGDVASYSISVENARDVAHAPIRLVYDPDVLELVSVEEGSFLSTDGATTRFLAREGNTAGILDISISRVPPARGIDGGGVLCTVTFLAKAAGSSPMVLAGSRLLDSDGQKLEFARGDSDVAVK